MIEKHGGLEDFVVDPFGFKYQVIPVHDDDDDDSDGDGEEDDDDDDEDKDGGDEVELVHQLCGPDGGFTSAGRDSLLFQVLLLNVHCFLSVVSLYRIELWDFESSLFRSAKNCQNVETSKTTPFLQIALNHEQPEWVPALTKVLSLIKGSGRQNSN